MQPPERRGHRRRVVGDVQPQKRLAEQVAQAGQQPRKRPHIGQAAQHRAADAAVLMRADLLTDERDGALADGARAGVGEVLHARAGGVPGDDRRAERVDRRLNGNVGDVEQAALRKRGEAEAADAPQRLPVDAEVADGQPPRVLRVAQKHGHGNGRGVVGDARRRRDARDVPAEADDEDQVQRRIEHARGCEDVQRPLRVARAAADGRAEVVHRDGRQAEAVDAEIEHGLVKNFVRRFHQAQQAFRARDEHDGKRGARGEADGEGRVRGAADALVVVRADVVGDADRRADGEVHHGVHDEVDERRRRADGRERHAPGELADDDEVDRVEQKLQLRRQKKRQRKAQNVEREAPARAALQGGGHALTAPFIIINNETKNEWHHTAPPRVIDCR